MLKDQLDYLGLETQVFKRVSTSSENTSDSKIIVLVKISAESLLIMATKNKTIVPIEAAGGYSTYHINSDQRFSRFPARQKMSLIKSIFSKEFEIDTLKASEVITDHFLMHDSQR